jgi:HB1, ASXL, restriction endonuclease HTH domain
VAEDDDARFREQLERRIVRDLLLESRLEVRLAELKEELAAISARRKSAEAMYQAEFGESFDAERPVQMEHALPARSGPLSGLSWIDAIERVLRESGPALHVKSIWENLEAGGFRTQARDPLRSIVAIVVREPSIVKVGPNIYALSGLSPSEDSSPQKEEVQS